MDAFLDAALTDADGADTERFYFPTYQPVRNGADPAARRHELKHHLPRFDIPVVAGAAIGGHQKLRKHIKPLRG